MSVESGLRINDVLRPQEPKILSLGVGFRTFLPSAFKALTYQHCYPAQLIQTWAPTGLHFLQDIKLFSIYRAAESLVWWVYINHRKGQQERWQEEQFQRPRFGKHTYVKVNIRPEQERMSEHGRKLLLLTICYEGKNYILKTHNPLNIPKIYNSQ